MRMTPSLVVQSALIGSFLLGIFGYLAMPAQATPYLAYSPIVHNGGMGSQGPLDGSQGKEKGLVRDGISESGCGLNEGFPESIRRWCLLVTENARAQGLAPDLIAALILQESGGDPLAYSHSGAVGLMQVMPRDGLAARFTCVNGPCFASRPTIQELEDPEFNISFGTRYLAGLVAKYGNLREALKAYGPMDVGYTYADKVLAIWRRYGG